MTNKKPRVALAMAYERDPMGIAHESMMATLLNPFHEIVPFTVGSTVIHLARNQMVEFVRSDKSIDYLVMVDSDQVWGPRMVERLIRWDVPVVSPVIVQRNGPALPVAYLHAGQDEKGQHRYNPRLYEIGAYMSQFTDDKFSGPSCILPADPDHPPMMEDLPPATREGLSNPLLEVDAVGTGMACFQAEMLRSLDPNPETGMWFDFSRGGEDFAMMRLIKNAGHKIYVDRGAFVGHCTTYVRGPDDLWGEIRKQEAQRRAEEAQAATLPPVTDLATKMRQLNNPPPWANTVLPQRELVAA